MDMGLIVVAALVLLAVIILAKTAVVVPQQRQYVVERLGKYAGTLDAGFHILVPFIDSIRYRHSLKESALDIRNKSASRVTTCKWGWTASCTSKCLTHSALPTASGITCLRSPSLLRRHCVVRSERSNSIKRSKSEPTSTIRS